MAQIDSFLIGLTVVDRVALHYGKPEERWIDSMTVAEAERYIREGHFAEGSMLPKVQSLVSFVKSSGATGCITTPAQIMAALRGEAGTRIVP